MIKIHYSILLTAIFAVFVISCKQEESDRTRVRTTDVEIPDKIPEPRSQQTPQQSTPPNKTVDIPEEQLFFEACLEGEKELINEFITNGIDISKEDENGRTGLMLASFNGHKDIVEKLIQKGAKINKTDRMGRTSLMYASTGHFPETVKLLLSHGAETNITDNVESFTALMFAGAEGNQEVISLLLEHGADPDLKDKDGDTAESFARQNGHNNAADLLKKASGKKK